MPFGLNRAEVIGRLGADVTINHLQSGGRVANLSIATDESYIDKAGGGERIDKTEWHRVVTFQNGLIDMLDKHAKKGRLVYVAGKLQTQEAGARTARTRDRFSDRDPPRPRRTRAVSWIVPAGTNGDGAAGVRTVRRRRPRPAAPMPEDGSEGIPF